MACTPVYSSVIFHFPGDGFPGVLLGELPEGTVYTSKGVVSICERPYGRVTADVRVPITLNSAFLLECVTTVVPCGFP